MLWTRNYQVAKPYKMVHTGVIFDRIVWFPCLYFILFLGSLVVEDIEYVFAGGENVERRATTIIEIVVFYFGNNHSIKLRNARSSYCNDAYSYII